MCSAPSCPAPRRWSWVWSYPFPRASARSSGRWRSLAAQAGGGGAGGGREGPGRRGRRAQETRNKTMCCQNGVSWGLKGTNQHRHARERRAYARARVCVDVCVDAIRYATRFFCFYLEITSSIAAISNQLQVRKISKQSFKQAARKKMVAKTSFNFGWQGCYALLYIVHTPASPGID